MLGGYKCLKFKGKVWDGNNYFSIGHMITQRITVKKRRKFVTGHNLKLLFKMHSSKKKSSIKGDSEGLRRKQRYCNCKFNKSDVSKIRKQSCQMLLIFRKNEG